MWDSAVVRLAAIVTFGLCLAAAAQDARQSLQAEINGLNITVDSDTGGLLQLEYGGMTFLQTSPSSASLLDAAYPGTGYDPLRLGVRYSHNARVEKSGDGIVIAWDALGMSRDSESHGSVAASVSIKPTADGRSVTLQGSIENRSDTIIPQVLFPDLEGLQPFAGVDTTEFRTCGLVKKPFRDLALAEDEGRWYASQRNWMELTSGAYDKSMAARWMDLGSLRGGFSLFPKLWSWGPLTSSGEPTTNRVMLHLSQVDRTLRLMCEHKVSIRPGETWTSPEYVVTPHRHGWAKGIEPFRAWIDENVQRPFPLPEHLNESLGYRTVWMAQQYADRDPAAPTVVWRFPDLSELAQESREHGINEMVLWLWQPWEIPDEPSPELGTVEEFNQAMDECRAKGVNVSLFVSVMTLLNPIPLKYGWDAGNEFWGYHTDFVPMLRPYYGTASHGAFADQTDARWQDDVTSSLLRLINRGWTSITWDQALHVPAEPNLGTIFTKVRAAAHERNAEATFAAENINNLDLDSRWLDYTWNWALFSDDLDWRALVNAYATPRFNVNVGTSPRTVKRLFMDHLFMNVLPSKPEGINGSAHIRDYPELSRSLKTCAKLHKTFQDYLENGLLIGDCVLSEPCPDARINGYILADKALIILMNTGAEARAIDIACDLAPWLPSPPGGYIITPYDEAGDAHAARTEATAAWRVSTSTLAPDELALFEIVAND